MRRVLLKLGMLAVAAAGAGLLVAWSGLIPIAASGGHWPATAWLLHFAMRQSVATQSRGLTPPDLEQPALVLRGAGHYATGCAPCHGTPGTTLGPIVARMTPSPPPLTERMHDWSPAELFWIVKHGIKYTAMPAWVAQQRDDEVWAMVAFLRRLPELDATEFRRLAYGERDQGGTPALEPLTAVLSDCARCHGGDGRGRAGAAPKLAGQSATYLLESLRSYAGSRRHSGIMQPIAAALDETLMRTLAEHYAKSTPADPDSTEDAAARRRGEAIAMQGIPTQGVPACAHCHGPKVSPRNPRFPRLDGQYADYLEQQLLLFKQGARGGSAYAPLMEIVARRMSEAQMRDVAVYYGGRMPAP